MPIQLRRPQKLVIEERRGRESPVTRTEYIELSGRDPVDFAVADGQAPLQLIEFVRATFGVPRGMGFGDETMFSYGDRIVIARDPTPNELREHSFRPLQRRAIPFQLTVPALVLQKAEHDAVLILRLGAVANALQTVLFASRDPDSTTQVVRERDLVHRAVIVASYVHEARKVIYNDKSHKGRLWNLVASGIASRQHIPTALVSKCQRLLDDNSPLVDRLGQLRNFLGFHLLPPEFRSWLQKRQPDESVMLMTAPDPRRADAVFVASLQAIADAYSDAQAAEFLGLAESLARVFPYIIEAAIYGLLHEQGLNSATFTALDLNSFRQAVEASDADT